MPSSRSTTKSHSGTSGVVPTVAPKVMIPVNSAARTRHVLPHVPRGRGVYVGRAEREGIAAA